MSRSSCHQLQNSGETFSTTLLLLATEVYEQDEKLRPQEYWNYKQIIQSYNKKYVS